MKNFMEPDFLLETKTAQELYHNVAENMPIFDFHNHLSPKEIYEDASYEDLASVWLGGDHYKWRIMRADGADEAYITGQKEGYEKFQKWTSALKHAFGNPLYHWSHLELQRYFNITETLTEETQEKIWNQCNEMLKRPEFTARQLLKRMKVTALCTTDDPADDLYYHKKLAEENFEIKVLPTFRPDPVLKAGTDVFSPYLEKLSAVSGVEIQCLDSLEKALESRLVYFIQTGCVVSDQSIEGGFYKKTSKEEAEAIFQKAKKQEDLCEEEKKKLNGYLLVMLGKLYHKYHLVMQLHIGALRDNSIRMWKKIGSNTGFDSMNDFTYAEELSQLLGAMDETGQLPKTILYCLNPKDLPMLACMAGNFQDGSCKGKVQLGAAWWFNDHKQGMEISLEALANQGVLTHFVGMLTDSRSFLSFSRHEYFRRILCNFIGGAVERGEYPKDEKFLEQMVRGICYQNAWEYFGLQ